jgi:hypothetical protein
MEAVVGSRELDGTTKTQTLRPFYFIVVVWGQNFRDYFLDFCLPSLLSPNNIPALRNRRGKFLICTTSEDWRVMETTPIFALLRRYIEPVLVEIPLPPVGRSGCEHMGIGHKMATDRVFRDRAYGVLVTPDYIVNDGAIAALQRHAEDGKRLVLVVALRFGEEPLFRNLAKLGALDGGERRSQLGQPLSFSSRQLVAAGIRSFHSETLRYGWESPRFSEFPAACWWSVPNEDGIVVHSLSWGPMLMDYATLERHDTTALETWTLDGDYLHANFGAKLDDIHVVSDSDEIMQISWAPLADRAQDLSPLRLHVSSLWGNFVKGSILRKTVLNPLFDPLKRKLLFVPVRWHSRPLSPAWLETEQKARSVLRRYLFDLEPRLDSFERAGNSGLTTLARVNSRWRGMVFQLQSSLFVFRLQNSLFRLSRVPSYLLYRVSGIAYRSVAMTRRQFDHSAQMTAVIRRAIRGDRAAWRRIFRRFGRHLKMVAGLPIENE